jgi:hypothetical protein
MHVGFVMDKVAAAHTFLSLLLFSQMIHNHISFFCHWHYTLLATHNILKWNLSLSLSQINSVSDCFIQREYITNYLLPMSIMRLCILFNLSTPALLHCTDFQFLLTLLASVSRRHEYNQGYYKFNLHPTWVDIYILVHCLWKTWILLAQKKNQIMK